LLAGRVWVPMFLGLVLASAAWAEAGQPARDAFARYAAAVRARDGAAAARLVTSGSLAREEKLRDFALDAPPATVMALPPTDRLAVLRLRHEFTAEELRPLSGADLVRTAVDEAWYSPKVLAALTPAEVEVTGGVAMLRVERAGDAVPVRLVLRQEFGAWWIDLGELAWGSDGPLEAALRERAAQAGVDLETAMKWAIEDTSGHLVDKDLWRPLVAGAG
jgi:hypothetical protein